MARRLIGMLTAAVALAGCGSSDKPALVRRPIPRPPTTVVASAAAPDTTAPDTTAPNPTPSTPPPPVRHHKQPKLPPKPPIQWDPIPFGAKRKAETVAYVRHHYGSFMKPTWRLIDPHVIVIHYTDATYGSTYNTFAVDVPDSELHELPATCAHYVIDTQGVIHHLVSDGTICRHTVGLNWTAIGIEHVGFSDAQVLDNRRQLHASLTLVHWLRCRFHIQIRNVIGHNESLSSPYHREDVPSLRTQTHADFNHHDMNIYRAELRALGGC